MRIKNSKSIVLYDDFDANTKSATININLQFQPDELIVSSISYVDAGTSTSLVGRLRCTDLYPYDLAVVACGAIANATANYGLNSRFPITNKHISGNYTFQLLGTTDANHFDGHLAVMLQFVEYDTERISP